MSRFPVQDDVQDQYGNLVEDATVRVYLDGTETLATIYEAETGGTAAAQSVVQTDSHGRFKFYVDEEDYPRNQQFEYRITKQGFTGKVIQDLHPFPTSDRTACRDSSADQGDASVKGSIAWHISDLSGSTAQLSLKTGDHDLTTSDSIPSTLVLYFENGGIIDGSGTLTFDSPRQIITSDPAQKIFGSSITVKFTNGGTVIPQWWGAIGSSDDAALIQNAIDSLESVPASGGGTVYCCTGTYNLASQIDIAKSYIGLVGDGPELTTFQRYNSNDVPVMVDINANAQLYGNFVEGIYFDCVSSAGFTGTNGFGLNMVDVTYGRVWNCRFHEFRCCPLLLQDSVANNSANDIRNVTILDIGDPDDSDSNDAAVGYEPDGIGLIRAVNCNIDGVYINNIGNDASGIMVYDGSNGNNFNNIQILNTENSGIAFDGMNGTRADLTRNRFSNVYIKSVANAGIWMLSNDTENADLSGNTFQNITIATVDGTGLANMGDGFRIECKNGTNKAQYIYFEGEFQGCTGYNIYNQNGRASFFRGFGGEGTDGWYFESGNDLFENELRLPTEVVTTGTMNLQTWGSTYLDSSGGAITATLPSGQYLGQRKTIVCSAYTSAITVSATNHETSDPEVATFDAVDEYWSLEWSGSEWVTIKATCTF